MKPIQTAGVIGLGSLGVLYATLFTRALGKEQDRKSTRLNSSHCG